MGGGGRREIGKSVGCCIATRLNFCLSASSSMQSGRRADWQECSDVRLRSLHLLPGVAGHNDQVAPVSVLCIQVPRILLLPSARLLPRVLHRLGQVSATPAMALPVLEFLSALVLVPTLYSGFVEQQYLSVFGIALPYTKSHK